MDTAHARSEAHARSQTRAAARARGSAEPFAPSGALEDFRNGMGWMSLRRPSAETPAVQARPARAAAADRREQDRELAERTRNADRMASIGMLGAGLGHDIQNVLLPLRAHLNAARSVGRASGTCGQEIHFEALRRGIDHLQHLADSLHLLSSESACTDSERIEATVLAAWWEQFEALFHCAMPRRTRLESRIGDDLPAVGISAQNLTRAMLNLLSNAARAIDARLEQLRFGGNVSVSVTAGEGFERGWVRISVQDNGVGMSPEVQRRATEAFFTTRNGGRGSGLGLSFVARVLEEHGGRLEIDSTEGVGTTMTMVLPEH